MVDITPKMVRMGTEQGGGRVPSSYVCARAGVTTSEQITVPTGARYVILTGNLAFTYAFGANPTAVVPSDIDDGTASAMITPDQPIESRTFIVGSNAKIAVAAASSCSVTAEFYRD